MFKTLTIKGILALCVVVFGLQNAVAQAAFWSETFATDAAFSAWTAANTGAGTVNWVRSTDAAAIMGFQAAPAAFASTTVADGFAFYNSDANGQNNVHDATLTYGPIDCSSHTNVGLRFQSQFADFQGSDVEVRVSTDAGATWTATAIFDDQPSYGFAQNALVPAVINSDMKLAAANGQATVWIQFRWSGDWEYGWKLDDIELYDYVDPKVNVTFRVNMSQVTVDPAGAKIAGSFTGWADADMTDAGAGIWTYTTQLNVGEEVLWKYKNGAGGWENVTAACGKDDGFGGFNRVYVVPAADFTLPAVCLGSCNPCVVTCDQNPNSIICDNLDDYLTTLKLGPQAPWWTTWSGTEGTTEDGIVTTEQAASAPNSFKILTTATGGGPQDVVLNLGNKTTGNYELKWKMFVPATKRAYYNIQNVVPIGAGDWNLDVFFEDNGAGRLQIGATAIPGDFTYPYDTWFEVKHQIDLDNNLLTLTINGQFVTKMAFAKNLGGIDFFGIDNFHTYYVDDVEYVGLPPVVYNVDVCDAAVDITTLFGGAPGVPQTSGLQDNTNATASATDPAIGTQCWGEPTINASMWYTFIGDGERYHIETVPCNATNYIGGANDPGDTQMAIFSGADCSDLELEVCNDDLSATGSPDWRAGLDIETTPGTTYYAMIDGFNLNGVVAKGEFCIEVTLAPSVDCNSGAVGTFTIANNGYLCFGDNLNTVMQPNNASFVIPTVGPVFGMAWCITQAPIPANTWPGSIAGVASTVFNPDVILVNLPNDGANFPAGVYYLTPVVVGGGTLIDPAGLARVFNVDPSAGCFFVGQSTPVLLMPDAADLEPLGGVISQTFGPNGTTLNLTPTGGLGDLLGDPTLYTYLWSNGQTTQDITVTGGGSYSVTINDISGCDDIDPAVISLVGAQDPESVKSLTLSPNPASTSIALQLGLDKTADVRAEIVNSIGQVVRTLHFGKTANVNQQISLAGFADGVYFLRLVVDGEKTQRSFVVSH